MAICEYVVRDQCVQCLALASAGDTYCAIHRAMVNGLAKRPARERGDPDADLLPWTETDLDRLRDLRERSK
jgi:hypothetical protein